MFSLQKSGEKEMKKIALVTGASAGLGKEFIRQLIWKDYDEVWAIARRMDKLVQLRKITRIPIRAIALDLTKKSSIRELEELLEKEKPSIHLLVNSAGFGKIGNYKEVSRQDCDRMIELNCRAAVDVTSICLPYMSRGDKILEICSVAAFQPLPYLNVYAATKAFLYHYSRALHSELRHRGITVTAVCPYWIKDTEFISIAEESEGKSRIASYPLASKKRHVVRRALLASYLGFPVSTPSFLSFIERYVCHVLPNGIMMGLWDEMRTRTK